MKALHLAALPLFVFSVAAQATVIQFDLSGYFTSTRDGTGSVFGNGAGDNTGVGQAFAASVFFDTSLPGSHHTVPPEYGNMHYIENDQIGGNPARRAPDGSSLDHSTGTFTVAGAQYALGLNHSFYNFLGYREDINNGSDSVSMYTRDMGLHKSSPDNADGTADYLLTHNYFSFSASDALGAMLDGLAFEQDFTLTAAPGSSLGWGSFIYQLSYFEDALSPTWWGATPDSYFADATGEFVLSSLSARVVNVPEPGSLAIFAAGLAGLALNRRRRAR